MDIGTTTPEWVRVKPAAKLIGIRAVRLYALVKETKGAIKTCRLVAPGKVKGAILIHLPSLLAYLKKLAEEQANE